VDDHLLSRDAAAKPAAGNYARRGYEIADGFNKMSLASCADDVSRSVELTATGTGRRVRPRGGGRRYAGRFRQCERR
jgi:hypothetical protein